MGVTVGRGVALETRGVKYLDHSLESPFFVFAALACDSMNKNYSFEVLVALTQSVLSVQPKLNNSRDEHVYSLINTQTK
jgi:hypothetical protein